MRLTFSIILFTCLFAFNNAKSQENWTLKKENNGIKVFSRKVEGFRMNELRVETILDCNLSQLVAVIADVNKYESWVYKTIRSDLLKQTSAADIYYYTQISVPWPFDNRDIVIHMTVQQNPTTKAMIIIANNSNDFVISKKNFISKTLLIFSF